MNDNQQEPETMPTSERMKTLAGAMTDALAHKAQGEHETAAGAAHTVDVSVVETVIEDWPDAPKRGAQQMLEQYGPPNEATPTKLFWYRAGPWKRIVVTRDVVTHNFPSPHSDFLTQYIDYKVPPRSSTRLPGSMVAACWTGPLARQVRAVTRRRPIR